MRYGLAIALAVAGVLLGVGTGKAQQPTQYPLDVIPEMIPFNIPYGSSIILQRAQAALQAAVDEATRRGWEMNVTVVGPAGDLLAFARMDNAQLASVQISQHKARAAALFRRPTRLLEDAVQKSDAKYLLSLDGVSLRAAVSRWSRTASLSAPSVARAEPARRTTPFVPSARQPSTSDPTVVMAGRRAGHL